MTITKRLAVAVLAAALLAPGAGAQAVPDYGMPRAMPSDYAAAQGVLPRAMPSDYAHAGAALTPQAGMPRAMPSDYDAYFASERKPVDGIDWPSAGIGAGIALGALLTAALAVALIRRNLQSWKKWIATTVGIAAIGTLAAVAFASPGSGTTSTNLVTADFENTARMKSDRVKFQTKDATDVRVQRIDFSAGAYSGWHHHPGIIIVAVQSGAVTLTDAECNSVTYGPGLPNGAVFVEGGDHPVQASSATGATVYVTYVAPDANPRVFRIEDDPPPCA